MSPMMDTPLSLPWWRRTPWLYALSALTVAALAWTFLRLVLGPPERSVRIPRVAVTVATVTKATFHDFIPLRARVVPLETLYLDAAEGGRVERLMAQPGDYVARGQALVQLSNTELELDVLEREGRLIESITQLQAYQTQLEQNRVANQKALALVDYNIERLSGMLARRDVLAAHAYASKEERELTQQELDYDQKIRPMQDTSNRKQEELRLRQLPDIESQLVRLRQDLDITHGKLDNLLVVAPAAGRLTSLDLKLGENRSRGDRIAVLTPAAGNKLSAEIDEYYLQRVRIGQQARVEVGEHPYGAVVSRAYPQVKNGTFTIDLVFSGATPEGLLPGQSVEGQLLLGEDREALIVPAGAFVERSGGEWVFVLDPGGHAAHRRAIRLGRRNAEELAVRAGLKAGEQVITSDYTGLEHVERIDLQ